MDCLSPGASNDHTNGDVPLYTCDIVRSLLPEPTIGLSTPPVSAYRRPQTTALSYRVAHADTGAAKTSCDGWSVHWCVICTYQIPLNLSLSTLTLLTLTRYSH